jgi:alpha-beta hydrolase superfamily lysophospholipase
MTRSSLDAEPVRTGSRETVSLSVMTSLLDTRLAPPAQRSFYISDHGESIFATFHEASAPARELAVVICPPFGWEDMCSYRSRREWASSLAAAGVAVLRIDLPGCGDSSGGPHDPGRVRAWTDAVSASARWLSSETAGRRIVAIGIGLGGAIAYSACVSGAPIDDLVLWGVASRGRRHVRELRAFSYMEHAHADPDATSTPTVEDADDGSLVVAGYVLSGETQRELDELDLAELDCSRLDAARVLMLERDGLAVDPRLRRSIEGCGAELTIGDGDGYAAMMMAELPHAVSAYGVFDTVAGWLAQGGAPARAASGSDARPATTSCAELSMPDGTRVRESPISIEHATGDAVGILCEPVGPAVELCAVWVNAGPQRRIGPNRMWVETARRWAARGVATVRVDLAAIGDADGDSRSLLDVRSYYTGAYLEQVAAVLDALEARGLPRRFLVGGLCAGAYWALNIAQQDPRVSAAAVLNPGYLVYDGGLSNALGQTRSLAPMLRQRSAWGRVLRGQISPSSHLSALRTIVAAFGRSLLRRSLHVARRKADTGEDGIARAFTRLREQDQRALVLFAGEERLYAELLAAGRLTDLERWPNVSLEHIEVAGDMHTLRPVSLQRQAHRLVDELLARELELIALQPA